MRITIFDKIAELPYNKAIFHHSAGAELAGHADRFTHWWFFAEQNGLNSVEYLLPQLRVETDIKPFGFEERFVRDSLAPPTKAQVEALGPWAYQIEMGSVQTLGYRADAEWKYHRYRKSLLVDTVVEIAGQSKALLSVLDVACHCGVFSLEFAEQGFRQVTGLDLRSSNIAQARFLGNVFHLPQAYFCESNARDIRKFPPADIIFCGGLLYHVTFPLELLRDLYLSTREFLVLDTLSHKHPISGFHFVANKDTNYSAEGEFHYELHPTYRAVCDALQAVGFKYIYEILGDKSDKIPNYKETNVRSFLAVKNENGIFRNFLESITKEKRGI